MQQSLSQPALTDLRRRVALTLQMIRFSHSIFALPFALLAAMLAARGLPEAATLGWIVLACVFARSAAMAFNRLHDEPYDRLNPRTQGWPLPAGLLTRRFVGSFCLACCLGFIVCAAMLNALALWLAPVALAILLGYSMTKRWTRFSHFFLGLALGIAPIGAWIGVRGTWDWPPLVLGTAVLCWVAGFDIIYSCQDARFDRIVGLHSLPARLGRPRALGASALSHGLSLLLFTVVGLTAEGLGTFYAAALVVAAGLLVWQQALVSPRDLTRLHPVLFTLNGWISVLLFLGGLTDVLLAS